MNVKRLLARRLTSENVEEFDYLKGLDTVLRTYFHDVLNACAGDEAAIDAAVNDIAGYTYQRFGVMTPLQREILKGED